jgi:SAM-dependent methyltransferase
MMLTRRQDAFGGALLDHLQGRAGEAFVERSDGLLETLHVGTYFTEHKDWSPLEQRALTHACGRVLDLGCGAGRHALYLQARGLEVVGIDNSPGAVETCRRRGLKEARVLAVAQVSRRLGVFDTILMLGNNFGLMENPRRARWLLRRFDAITSPRAGIIAQTLDPYRTSNPSHRRYHRVNRAAGRMGGQIRLRVRYRLLATPWFDYLFVSRAELGNLLRGSRWLVERYIQSEGPIYFAILTKRDGN